MRRIVHQGGQWSGKTVNILGALATLASEEVPSASDSCVTTVTSMSMPHLKGGALRDFEDYVYPSFRKVIKKYNRTDHLFTFKSGSKIEFKVYENEMTARGNKRKRLFVNEANSFPWLIFYQLDSRSEQSIIDYNPSLRFWAHEKIIGQDGTHTMISDHRHNPFLDESKHYEIENNPDFELWKVYARGLTGNISGVIFPNWEMIDDSLFPSEEECFYGIDFGYTVDPTALMKMCKIGNTLYVKELSYTPGLSELQIKNLLASERFNFEYDPLYCENDPDMIRALRNVGINNAIPARKPPGSVYAGIQMLNQINVKYTNNSQNLHRERGLYVWIKDKNSGEMLNVPVDNNNHCFDAIRYGYYSKYLRQSFAA